jgi:uncharacterized protein
MQIDNAKLRDFIDFVARSLVDNPEAVEVTQLEGEATSLYSLKVAPEDLGKVIGKKGRTARAMRTLLAHLSREADSRAVLEILD